MTQHPQREDGPATAHDVEYWAAVETVFSAALDTKPEHRRLVLDALCADKPGLRADVESLLDAHGRAGDFIAPATLGTEADTHPAASSDDLVGARVGMFRVIERIARGGMGEVYRAERADADFSQSVAIKLLAGRLTDPDSVRRFRAERQFLASLQHPNIVQLLDGGVSADGRPFIVMEYVEGVSITEYCRRNALSLPARLRLFLQVTGAVRWAHRHLIVHRDLKPDNVLVTTEGVVKVLDFGVAKLLAADDDASSATVTLLAPMTPNYASPEQIKGQRATTACDVYSLGVMLFELVAGRRPYETAGKTADEVRDIVLQHTAVRPSAAAVRTLPYDAGRLRGDVDAIVSKAMADDPRRRYASVDELADDLERQLNGRAVVAREPSFRYLAGKAIARHRGVFAVSSAALVLLVAMLIGAVWQAHIAATERERAMQRFNDVRELAGALIFRIHDEVAPLPGSTPVRRTIVAQGLEFLQRLEADVAADDRLRVDLAQAYVRIGHVQGRLGEANLGDRDGAIRSYTKARDVIAPLTTVRPLTWEVASAAVDARLALAGVLERADAQKEAREALAIAAAWSAYEPQSSRSKTLLARGNFHTALLIGYPGSLSYWEETSRLFDAVLGEQPQNLTSMRNAALAQKYLGTYFETARDSDRALTHYQRALSLDEQRAQAAPGDRQNELDLAIDIGNIANVQLNRRDYDASIEAYQRSLVIRERIAAADPKDVYAQSRVAFVHTKLGTLYLLTSKLDLAHEHAERAVRMNESLPGQGPAYRDQQFAALKTLADVDWTAGRRAGACDQYRRARSLVPGVDTPAHLREDVETSLRRCNTLSDTQELRRGQ